ncbi:MAG: 4-hydroxybenzoate octaprenyltransferase [Alphaproteobacteria bacterium]|nr:MAG: 4-hydroxybenzoate octaprenyltransferase [Alphaproteobacteria bacterium]
MVEPPSPVDIPAAGWIARLPQPLRACARLARLDRPIGTWLLLFPCWWGLALAGSWDPWLYLLMAVGAVVMRGAGCTVNDIADRHFDAQVARTATRPLPAGEITVAGATLFLLVQLAFGLAVLVQMPWAAVVVGAASLVLVVSYPFMKRITWWPQAVLGLAFNWGALLAPAAVLGDQVWSWWLAPLLLWLGGIAWTLGYDTIYAHQDKADDARIGVKSTALRLGVHSMVWIRGFYLAACLLWAAAILVAGLSWLALIAVAGCAALFYRQLHGLDFDDPSACLTAFKANTQIGWMLLAGLIAGSI